MLIKNSKFKIKNHSSKFKMFGLGLAIFIIIVSIGFNEETTENQKIIEQNQKEISISQETKGGPSEPAESIVNNDQSLAEEKIIVKLKQETDTESLAKDIDLPADKIKEISADTYAFTADAETKKKLSDKTEYIENDAPLKLLTTPNDPSYSSQSTYFVSVNGTTAWTYSTGSTAVKVAIVDTGINGAHEDLSGRVLAGYDYITSSAISANSDSDGYGHGTTVAGSAFAVTNNSLGITGLDWSAYLIPVKVFDNNGNGNASDAALGIRWAADNGADIINMSFGTGNDNQALKEAVEYAWSKGKVLVGASGNDSAATIYYPARYEQVIAVGSINSNNARSSFSNYGDGLDVVAPGESILATKDGNGTQYESVSGTSISAGLVSATAALVKAYNPNLSNDDIKHSVVDNTINLGSSSQFGAGKISIADGMIKSYSSAFTHRYSYQTGHPTLNKGDNYNFSVTVTNTGRSTWNQNIVHLGTSRSQDRISSFIREGDGPSGWITPNRILMQESSVVPGSTATFSFYMKSPSNMNPGTYREYFRLVADGVTWMEDYGIYWDVKVRSDQEAQEASYRHSYSNQNGYPTIVRGGNYNFQVTVTNTGTTTWNQSVVHLGTSRSQDRISSFIREGDGPSGWITPNRILMQESSVVPGSTATFSFYMKSPSNMNPGTYREYFRLVADGVTWMEDYGIYWDVTVS